MYARDALVSGTDVAELPCRLLLSLINAMFLPAADVNNTLAGNIGRERTSCMECVPFIDLFSADGLVGRRSWAQQLHVQEARCRRWRTRCETLQQVCASAAALVAATALFLCGVSSAIGFFAPHIR